MDERRRTSRRLLPTQRSAVVEIDGSTHLALLVDLAPDGAFLSTRLQLEPGTQIGLRVVVPGSGRPALIPSEVVWSSARFDPDSARPAGMAVRFRQVDDELKRRLTDFCDRAAAARTTARSAAPAVEYRLLEVAELRQSELDALGADGWSLSAAVPSAGGFRLVFQRRA